MPIPFAKAVAKTKCFICQSEVTVKINKGGNAYFFCDECGVNCTHRSPESSQKWLERIGAKPLPVATPEPKAEAKPTPKPEPKPAPKKRGFFDFATTDA